MVQKGASDEKRGAAAQELACRAMSESVFKQTGMER